MNTPLNWTRRPCGDYLSECGRFRITFNEARPIKSGRWNVTDTGRKDPVLPAYNVMYNTDTLTHAKSVAARWARQFPTVAAV